MEWGECYIPGNVAKHFGKCPQTFRGISPDIPGNVVKHSGEYHQTFRGISPNIPGNEEMEIRTQGQSKISSCCFCVWCKSRELGGRGSPIFPCLTPVVECFLSDLLRAIVSYWVELHSESCQTFRMVLLCENNQRP